MPLLKKLQSLFSPRLSLQGNDSPTGGLRRRIWVVPRGRCLYRLFAMGDVPQAERNNALEVLILQWSPFDATGRYIVWNEDQAQVWIWDDEAQKDDMQQAGLTASGVSPEPVLRPKPEFDGAYLLTCPPETAGDSDSAGVEGQVWRNGVLAASHWWRRTPTGGEWRRFLLANDLSPNMAPPPPMSLPLQPKPWRGATKFSSLSMQQEKIWVMAGVILFGSYIAWQGAAIHQWNEKLDRLVQQEEEIGQEARPQRAARSRAIRFQDEAQRLKSMVGGHSLLELLALLSAPLPEKGVSIIDIDYARTHVALILQGKSLDALYYIKKYQATPMFTNITAARGQAPDSLQIDMDIIETE